jgi:hypothetical protein
MVISRISNTKRLAKRTGRVSSLVCDVPRLVCEVKANPSAVGSLCHNYPCLCLVYERITIINSDCKSIPFVVSEDWNLNLCVSKQTKMKRKDYDFNVTELGRSNPFFGLLTPSHKADLGSYNISRSHQ